MSTNTEATTTTTTTVSTESQLNDVITSIYYARHHLDEIPPIKGKIEHLQNMLSSLEAEQTLQVASDSLETNLRQLKSELNHEIKEQERQEQAVINGIKSILQREQHNIINKVTSKSNVVSEFKNFCILLNSQVHKHGKAIQDALDSIGTSIAASFQFGHALSELQSTMIAEQGKLIATLNEHSRVDDIKRFEKLTSAANKLNIHEHLRQQTNTGIKEIKRINVELEAERKEAAAKETHIPEGIVQLLDELVTQPSVKQKLTERQQKYAEQLEAIFEHIKKETNRIVDLMAQHKFIMDDTRIWMDTFGLPEEEGCRDQETMMGAMKRALDDIADISHGMASKAKEMDQIIQNDGTNHALHPSKKRRVGDDTKVDDRMEYLDTHIQQLDDYLSQFKESVLAPMFPLRIETVMKKIKSILLNHETLFAYLINPTLTSKDIEEGNTRQMDSKVLNDIVSIVHQESEKTNEALRKRIKTLEDSLEVQ